jgi:hypothetical protein
LVLGIVASLTAALVIPQGLEGPVTVLPPPAGQLGGHQALASQQGPDLSGLGTPIGFLDDAGPGAGRAARWSPPPLRSPSLRFGSLHSGDDNLGFGRSIILSDILIISLPSILIYGKVLSQAS